MQTLNVVKIKNLGSETPCEEDERTKDKGQERKHVSDTNMKNYQNIMVLSFKKKIQIQNR